MKAAAKKPQRCAIYTRVSTENGLEQEFNSLHAQREAAQAYIKSQVHEGWKQIRDHYDDGGFSGGTLDRPALQKLLAEIRERRIDIVVVYKVDRLTRSLTDFAKLVELFDVHGVAFVSVTQSFNTTTSMGRLTRNVLLSFAPVRARSHRRAHSRQDRGLQEEGSLGRRRGPFGLQSPGPQADRQRGRSGRGAVDLLALSRPGVVVGVAAGFARARNHHPKANAFIRARNRRPSSHQWATGPYAAQPSVPR